MLDPRLPLQYRGISLLSTVYKIYSSVINNRVMEIAETHKLFVDEQNGFRAKRSCDDHIYSLTTVIRNRQTKKLPTFVAFVDLEKAFDRVDRQLLFYKLRSMGLGGKLYQSIKGIYANPMAAVNINEYITGSFVSDFGVRQGDPLSPTLFSLFLNDLAEEIKNTGLGINMNDRSLNILLYADDLALITESETDLQTLLSILYNWCQKWRMKVNVKKTKVVHFRCKNVVQSDFQFKYGDNTVDIVEKYKYLGLILDEYLDYQVTATVLANSAGRALGSIQNKFNQLKGLGYNTYSKMYSSGVIPIMDYCSGIWGYKNHSKCDTVQNRALRFFLGVSINAPNHAIKGDMAWLNPNSRHKIEMLRYWNRLMLMDDSRITKHIFKWDKSINKRNWCNEVFKILSQIDQSDVFNEESCINLDRASDIIYEQYKGTWKSEVKNVAKLRTYALYKDEYQAECFVYKVIDRGHRSILSRFRCGILPLAIETGRYTETPLEYRLCKFCQDDVLEDELHFLLRCNYYNELRSYLIAEVICKYPDFYFKDDVSKIQLLMNSDLVKHTAEFLYKAYNKRKYAMYH